MGAITVLAAVALATALSTAQRFETDSLPAGDGVLVCRITSDTSEPRRVRVEAIDDRGTATFDSGVFALAAGATFLSSGGLEAARCRFSVEGVARGVRAHGVVVMPDGSARSLPPAPVR